MKPSRLIIIIAILFFASPIIFAWWFRAGTMQAVKAEPIDTANWITNHSRIVKGE